MTTPQAPERKTVMIDASYLKVHRTAPSFGGKKGITLCIPGWKVRGKADNYDKRRNCIKIMLGRFKDWRRVQTRCDQCPKTYLSAAALAAIVIFWL